MVSRGKGLYLESNSLCYAVFAMYKRKENYRFSLFFFFLNCKLYYKWIISNTLATTVTFPPPKGPRQPVNLQIRVNIRYCNLFLSPPLSSTTQAETASTIHVPPIATRIKCPRFKKWKKGTRYYILSINLNPTFLMISHVYDTHNQFQHPRCPFPIYTHKL